MRKGLIEKLIIHTHNNPSFLLNNKNDEERIVIEGSKLMKKEKLIAVRADTNTKHFPEHSHDYVEIIYMYQGTRTNIINNETVVLNQGDILFMTQNCRQENLPSTEQDIAVYFVVLPPFFEKALEMLNSEESLLHSFLIQCLRGENGKSSYLHFSVSDVLPVQNLIENLIWNLLDDRQEQRNINETTMGLILLQLLSHIDELDYNGGDSSLVFHVLKYIEAHFANGSLTELAKILFYDFNALSKQIKKLTGKTYTELVQEKRMSHACFLLESTNLGISEISQLVGYENISYFHRIFRKFYNMSPKKYRDKTSGNPKGQPEK